MQTAAIKRKLCSTRNHHRSSPCPAHSTCQPWDLEATYSTPCRPLDHCYTWVACPKWSLLIQDFQCLLLITIVLQKSVLFVFLHCGLYRSTLEVHRFANTPPYHKWKETQAPWLRKKPSITCYCPSSVFSAPESSSNSLNNAPAIQCISIHQTSSGSIPSWWLFSISNVLLGKSLPSSLGLPLIHSQKLCTQAHELEIVHTIQNQD